MIRCASSKTSWPALVIAMAAATAASAQQPPPGTEPEKPTAPETAPAKPTASPVPTFAILGPSREIKLAENTWFRFGAQVQAWYRAAQDRILQASGSDGTYAMDFYCRRCRFFATGSVVKDVFFNVLFEAGNFGRADLTQPSTKTPGTAQILDAYGQVKFFDWLWVSGGSILLPLSRNGLQPTTTYVSIDVSNIAQTPVAQGNSFVLRDLGFQANGFFAANHVEYRLGVFQGSRQAAATVGTPPVTTQTASHNGPRLVAMLSANLWDTETGYVNGGHYFGAKRVLGVMGNFDYQVFRTDAPPSPGTSKNEYKGFSAAAFINYPLSGQGSPRGGDEIVGLLQFGYYDGGLRQAGAAPTELGTYPTVLKQTNYLAEAGYYNHSSRFSVFGKFEFRKISDDYVHAFKEAGNQTWIAGGLKYYVGPFNFMNFAVQYERIVNNDAPTTQQRGTHNFTFQMQTLLY